MALLSLASLPLKTESLPLLSLRLATPHIHQQPARMKNGAEVGYLVNRHVFVCLDLGENSSVDRNALNSAVFLSPHT